MIDTSLAQLNKEQREAVCVDMQDNCLVLAGAGSGKTKVLVSRIAYLLEEVKIAPYNILALTFTNKAAKEILTRVKDLVGIKANEITIGTFHSVCHKFLRINYKHANLNRNFQIIDANDQLSILKKIIGAIEFNSVEEIQPKIAMAIINDKKEHLIRAYDYEAAANNPFEAAIKRIYLEYEEITSKNNLVDFAELILRFYETLQKNAALLRFYSERFKFILVDEFQDTNYLQYLLINKLAKSQQDLANSNSEPSFIEKLRLQANPTRSSFTNSVFVVGDDDQSIYSWRGAKVENLNRFKSDFKPKFFKLEKNYRSTKTILNAANALISNNKQRLGKNLWCDAVGEKINIFEAYNSYAESRYVAESTLEYYHKQGKFSDIAVLYRNNSLSRNIEKELINYKIPYRVFGGMKFFERAEVKDALAYMKLLANKNDNLSFERIINHPPRGIGKKTLDSIKDIAAKFNLTLWQATLEYMEPSELSGQNLSHKLNKNIADFVALITFLDDLLEQETLKSWGNEVLRKTGLEEFYNKDKTDKGQNKVDNLYELISAITSFSNNYTAAKIEAEEDADLNVNTFIMQEFFAEVILDSDNKDTEANQNDYVSLMTLHSAKGLEFNKVYIIGFEENIFPSKQSIDEGNLEEERRLAYVGVTRAKKYLDISFAKVRSLYGNESYMTPSRFLEELEAKNLNYLNKQYAESNNLKPAETLKENYSEGFDDFDDYDGVKSISLGHLIEHEDFGIGKIIDLIGQGMAAKIKVDFSYDDAESKNHKWFLLNHHKIHQRTS